MPFILPESVAFFTISRFSLLLCLLPFSFCLSLSYQALNLIIWTHLWWLCPEVAWLSDVAKFASSFSFSSSAELTCLLQMWPTCWTRILTCNIPSFFALPVGRKISLSAERFMEGPFQYQISIYQHRNYFYVTFLSCITAFICGFQYTFLYAFRLYREAVLQVSHNATSLEIKKLIVGFRTIKFTYILCCFTNKKIAFCLIAVLQYFQHTPVSVMVFISL